MKEHDIVMCQVPANMTHLFQLLDLIEEGLIEVKDLEYIDILLTLSMLKPLHAS